MVEGIVFDMDGVLADTEHFYQKRREAFLIEKQFRFEAGLNFIGSNEKAIWEVLVPDNPKLRQDMMMEYREYRANYPEPYKELVDSQVKPLFIMLKNQGLKISIASSSDLESIDAMIDAAGINGLVDYRISGTECSAHKPDPEIYRKALHALGLTPDQAFAVEDSPSGIAAALNAGLKVYALKPRHGEVIDQSAATAVIGQLKEVLTLLLK